MAANAADADDCRARELDLLSSGNFSDVEIVCGERVWKCHRAILASRSVWFRKALNGPFQEATSRRVNLEEKDPFCVYLALKYIYGNGLDVESSVSPVRFMEECVSLWQTADFLLLSSLKSSVEKAVHNYCDKRMKQLCTRRLRPKWKQPGNKGELTPWAIDMILGIRGAYKWNIEVLKAVLVEFVWAGRLQTLDASIVSTMVDRLEDTPAFVTDLLAFFASPGTKTTVWAPRRSGRTRSNTCRRCDTNLFWENKMQAEGQIHDPFGFGGGNGWCRDCAKMDIIPWR